MATVQEWCDTLESLQGLSFVHQGRNEHGVDCYGLLIHAGSKLGMVNEEHYRMSGYKRLPGKRVLDSNIGRFLVEKPYNRLQPLNPQLALGDILVMFIDDRSAPRHLGVVTSRDEQFLYMTHADAMLKRVIRTRLSSTPWSRRVMSVWRYPNFEDG